MSEERPPQVVVCCAIRSRLGKHIIAGCRHFDAIMRHQIEQVVGGRFTWRGAEQGFLDQYGTFLTREEAWIIAERNGQIVKRCGGDGVKLFSENLY